MNTAAMFVTIEHSQAMKFIMGGHAEFTVHNTQTGNKLVVTVAKHKTASSVYLVWLQDGHMIIDKLFVGQAVRYPYKVEPTEDMRKFAWFFKQLNNGTLPEHIQIMHHGKCGACGRPLTDPLSIQLGIGPKCRANV